MVLPGSQAAAARPEAQRNREGEAVAWPARGTLWLRPGAAGCARWLGPCFVPLSGRLRLLPAPTSEFAQFGAWKPPLSFPLGGKWQQLCVKLGLWNRRCKQSEESGECPIFTFLEALLVLQASEGRAAAGVVFFQHDECEIESSPTGSAAETPPNPILNSQSLWRTRWKLQICSPEKCRNIDTHPAVGIQGTQATSPVDRRLGSLAAHGV